MGDELDGPGHGEAGQRPAALLCPVKNKDAVRRRPDDAKVGCSGLVVREVVVAIRPIGTVVVQPVAQHDCWARGSRRGVIAAALRTFGWGGGS